MYILTIEEKTGILDAQSVRGHAGIVSIILFGDVGNHENCGSAKNLNINALGIGQPGEERQTEVVILAKLQSNENQWFLSQKGVSDILSKIIVCSVCAGKGDGRI